MRVGTRILGIGLVLAALLGATQLASAQTSATVSGETRETFDRDVNLDDEDVISFVALGGDVCEDFFPGDLSTSFSRSADFDRDVDIDRDDVIGALAVRELLRHGDADFVFLDEDGDRLLFDGGRIVSTRGFRDFDDVFDHRIDFVGFGHDSLLRDDPFDVFDAFDRFDRRAGFDDGFVRFGGFDGFGRGFDDSVVVSERLAVDQDVDFDEDDVLGFLAIGGRRCAGLFPGDLSRDVVREVRGDLETGIDLEDAVLLSLLR